MITLIIGGTRSGKSSFAERYCLKRSKNPAYIATAEIYDSEMKNRVEKHQERRNKDWVNFEEPYNVAKLLEEIIPLHEVILLDCLTIYITNLMLKDFDFEGKDQEDFMEKREKEIEKEILDILNLIPENKELVIVSNEVGMGIVPENFISRVFRDISGRMNQLIGSECDQLIISIAGIPIKIKPELERI